MTFSYLPNGNQKYTDNADFWARFIMKKQLLDETLWQKFVEVFLTQEDAADDGLLSRVVSEEPMYAALPAALRSYLAEIERLTGVGIAAVSISPDRKDVLFKQ